MYNIKVSTGKNTWFLAKIDDDADDDDGDDDDGDDDDDGGGGELGYSFLNILFLVKIYHDDYDDDGDDDDVWLIDCFSNILSAVLGRVLYQFGNKTKYWSKVAMSSYHSIRRFR